MYLSLKLTSTTIRYVPAILFLLYGSSTVIQLKVNILCAHVYIVCLTLTVRGLTLVDGI